MRPVSGEDLVTAALKSSLARAQKNYSKFSNHKLNKLNGCRGGEEHRKLLKSVNRREDTAKGNTLKFQSDFDLWREQASAFNFVSEGFTNGASVPEGIECLNSTKKSKNKVVSSSVNGTDNSGGVGFVKKGAAREDVGKVVSNSEHLRNKNGVSTENAFELLKKLKEDRKVKKKVVKLRKRLLKQGYSFKEAEAIIKQAKDSNFSGAILKQGNKVVLDEATHNPKKLKQELLLFEKTNKSPKKMKDILENGCSAPTINGPRPRPNTPPGQPQINGCGPSSSGVVNGAVNSNNGSNQQHQLPQPKRVLYPREKIVPGYIEDLPVGAGFFNMGNSCYLNASLQAVFHVPAFINWLRSDVEHRKHCQDNGTYSVNCIVCAMKKTFESANSRNAMGSIKPVEILNRLRSICRHFSHGRQEDAHEFLRYLFESMEKSYLAAINCLRLDNRSKETNPLGQIFGGYIRTEVTCQKCRYVSTTFQPTAELQLDIRHHTSLDDAIEHHFKKERLDNNDYKCEKCRTISQATKQFSLEVPPIVLCLQLKRFTLYGTKIAKRIHCNRYLEMSKYMHKSKQVNGFSNLRYRLAALVTHLGSSPNCGHYTAIAQAADGQFYQFDDSYVHPVTTNTALNNDAYVIIYEMEPKVSKSPESSKKVTTDSRITSNITGLGGGSTTSSTPAINSIFPKKIPSATIPKLTPQTSKLVRNLESEGKSMSINGNGRASLSSSSNCNGSLKSDQERKLISFGIRPPGTNKINLLKPGVTLTNSSKLGAPSTSTSTLPQSTSAQREKKTDPLIKLVPYNDDENEESDKDENGRGRATSPDKRLNSPRIHSKQSPKRSTSSNSFVASTPPKSPKTFSCDSASPSSSNIKKEKNSASEHETTTNNNPSPVQSPTLPTEEKEMSPPRKSRSQKRRSSSSSSSGSGCSSLDREKNSQHKRMREEQPTHSSPEKRSSSYQSSSLDHNRDHNNRDRFSQERERERRRNRNPSPGRDKSRSPSVDNKEKKQSNCDQNSKTSSHENNSVKSEPSFDVSRVSQENSIKSWNGERSTLSKSMEEERKRANEKSVDESYDDDFDTGRVKKVRRSHSLPKETEQTSGNKFQFVEDRKKQVEQWTSLTDVRRNNGSNGSIESNSWNNESRSRDRNSFSRSSTPNNGNGTNGPTNRPRSFNSTVDYSSPQNQRMPMQFKPRRFTSSFSRTNARNSHGRSPFRNGHHGNGNHHRSQSYNSYHQNGSNHSNNDRSRH